MKLLLVIVCFTCVALTGRGQSVKTVVVSGKAFFSADKTREEVRDEALANAFREARAQGAGIMIRSESYWAQVEHARSDTMAGKMDESYAVVTTSSVYGLIVRNRVLEEKFDPAQGYYEIKVECDVAREEGKPDPSFKLDIQLSQDLYYDRGIINRSDEVVLTLVCSQDAYLTVFDVYRDSARVLVPSEMFPSERVLANAPVEIPPPSMRLEGVRFRVQVPTGKKRTMEQIIAVATKQQIPLPGGGLGARSQSAGTLTATIEEMNTWLAQIPPDQRTVASRTFEIHKKL
jgi:hypothetical protein